MIQTRIELELYYFLHLFISIISIFGGSSVYGGFN